MVGLNWTEPNGGAGGRESAFVVAVELKAPEDGIGNCGSRLVTAPESSITRDDMVAVGPDLRTLGGKVSCPEIRQQVVKW